MSLFHLISTIVSWTVFVLLLICMILLLYYFISMKLYAAKGDKYEPAFSLYTIISPSMVPNLNVYDVVINTRVDSQDEIKIGDVITFKSESAECYGKTVTHRVVSIKKDENGNCSYQTKGDNNFISDSSLAPYKNIIGKVLFKIPQLGRIQIILANNSIWMLVLFLIAIYILLKDFIKAIKKYSNFNNTNLAWLNRPIITGRKLKMLPEPHVHDNIDNNINAGVSIIDDECSNCNINVGYSNDNENISIDDLPNLYTDYNDDISMDDLPKLKKK